MRLLTLAAIVGLLLVAAGVAGCGAATAVPGSAMLGGVVAAIAIGPLLSARKTRRDP